MSWYSLEVATDRSCRLRNMQTPLVVSHAHIALDVFRVEGAPRTVVPVWL